MSRRASVHKAKKRVLNIERQKQDSIYRSVQVEQMQESLDNMRRNMQLIRERVANLNIKSPIDGELGLLDVVLGQSVSMGQKIGKVNELYKTESRTNYIIAIASFLAIFISLIGVFGLVLYETQFRKKEIGVRRVFGAIIKDIICMINTKYMYMVFICFIMSIPISWYIINKWLSNFEYRIPIYWWVFIVAFLLIIIITNITVTISSWRAANNNPINTLKSE